MGKQKTVTLSSVFPAAAEDVWQRLQQISTLQYIAKPFVIFTPLDQDLTWLAGREFRFRLFVFGFIPIGIHVIRIEEFSADGGYRIQTREHDPFMPVWNHLITLEPMGEKTRYTDHVIMQARCFHGAALLWARLFYRHRQQRWLKLLKKAAV